MSKSTLKTYIKTADKVFSRYIRAKYSDRYGCIRCYTCGKKMFCSDAEAGHFIGRRKWAVRYDEKNVRPQCTRCNRWEEGKKPEYAMNLISEYGDEEIINELIRKSNQKREWDYTTLKQWVKEWKQEIEKLSIIKVWR